MQRGQIKQAAANSTKLTLFYFSGLALLFLSFQSSLIPFHHVAFLRIIRSIVLTGMTLLALQVIWSPDCLFSPQQRFRQKIALGISTAWLCCYLWVFAHLPGFFQSDCGNYFLFPTFLYALVEILSLLAEPLNKPLRTMLCLGLTGVISFLLLSALCCLFYFLIYHQPLDEIILLSILATTPSEAWNYLSSFSNTVLASVALIGIMLPLGTCFLLRRAASVPLPSFPSCRKQALLLLVTGYFFCNYGITVFPADRILHLYQKSGPMNMFITLRRNLKQNGEQLTLTPSKAELSAAAPGTVILVLGESASRDQMSAFSPTATNTTPWEKQVREHPHFYFFPNAYSNFPNTIMAVTLALTNVNQYNELPMEKALDMMTLAKKAGFHTYWFSNQDRNTVSDSAITLLASQADYAKWIHGYDEKLLSLLKEVPGSQNNFIVLHLMGSHFRYDKRVPESYRLKRQWSPLPKTEKREWYQRSLHYTDEVLHQLFVYSRDHMRLQCFIYCSDHGENMQYTHTSSPFYFDMVRIPFWVYLSPEYEKTYPDTAAALLRHENSVFTNDLLFDTVAGLLHCSYPEKDPAYDLTDNQYGLTLENARTLHGKRFLSEEGINKQE
jgi:heptose-I-phosphate ethanolaminephosphotransferase